MSNESHVRMIDDIKQHLDGFIMDGMTGGFMFDDEAAKEMQEIKDKLSYLQEKLNG